MKAKCKKCGDTIEVTKPREYKSCKCGAINLDYGDGEYYFRVGGDPEDFDGEIEDAPKIRFVVDSMEKGAKISEPHEKKIIHVMWGNSSDESICAIVFVDDGYSKRLFLGSRERYTTEDYDVRHIADWGNEITKADLERLLKMIGE